MKTTDLIIIGSGPGGYRAAEYAAKHGLQVIVIEKDELGGTCLNRGCIPTKTLCRNAEITDMLREADKLGLKNLSYDIDFSLIKERQNTVIEQLRNGVEFLMSQPGITFVHGNGSFKDNKTVVVGNEEYTADNIIIATGAVQRCRTYRRLIKMLSLHRMNYSRQTAFRSACVL